MMLRTEAIPDSHVDWRLECSNESLMRPFTNGIVSFKL